LNFNLPLKNLQRELLYERLASGFLETIKRRVKDETITKMKFWKIQRRNIVEGFRIFVDEIKINIIEPHAYPQFWHLEDKGITLEDIDHIFLFESLSTDFNAFLKKYSIEKNLIHAKLTTTDPTKKNLLLTLIHNNKEIQEKIYKIYKKDFELYERAKEILKQRGR